MTVVERSAQAQICVLGRIDFATGIGTITYAVCEMLSRSFPVCILPTEPAMRGREFVTLPSGREVPVCQDASQIKVWIFTDVLWNGAYDTNYLLILAAALRIAYIVFDSDELPPEWTSILNERFDLAIVPSQHLQDVARANDVEIPVAVLPIALDLERLLTRPFAQPDPSKIRFLSVAALHPRKQHDTLIQAFAQAFGNRSDVELVLHSNIAFGDTAEQLSRLIRQQGVQNIHLSRAALSDQERDALLESCDVFVNLSRGEGYSVGAREALALGKPLVLSGVGGHLDLAGAPGIQLIEPARRVMARYPEIDNRVFGWQYAVEVSAVVPALQAAYDFVASGEHLDTRHQRRAFAADFSFSRLSTSYAEILHPTIRQVRRRAPAPALVSIPDTFAPRVRKAIGPAARALSHGQNRVIQMHDGGYYSIFNVFISHLVWNLQDERCHRTLPDWDAGRLIERNGGPNFTSFCYGRPDEGNFWLSLYEPLFGLSAEEMNDRAFLYEDASVPERIFNEDREPLLTYINAYRLYRWKGFPAWRRQYHRVYRDHIHMRPELEAEIEAFTQRHFAGRYMVAAHVRHPAHVIEQPGSSIAQTQTYIDRIAAELRRRGIDPAGSDWGVFLATDQGMVVNQFLDAYGDRVCWYPDVRRTTAEEHAAFEALSPEEKRRDGSQVQHLVASTPQAWSSRMAWEIIRDAVTMSRCRLMFHVVSNVSTAVSYMNPEIEMIFTS